MFEVTMRRMPVEHETDQCALHFGARAFEHEETRSETLAPAAPS